MKKTMFIALLLVFGVFIAGCVNQAPSTGTQTTQEQTTSQETQTTTTPIEKYPLKVVDFANREVTIESEPERIVSLAPSITETLYFIGALDKVIGITKWDNYPENVQEGRTVVGDMDPNIEVIASLNPDLIIALSYHIRYLDQLEKIAPVVIVEPQSIEGIYKALELLGNVTNRPEQAQEVIIDMKNKIEDIQKKVEGKRKPKVFYIVWGDPLMTAGNGTFINELLTLAGGDNIFGDVQGWAQVSIEEVIARNPEVIILPPSAGITANELCQGALANTDAVKNGNVYTLSNDDIISRQSPRIVEGLEEIAMFLYPEEFNLEVQPLVCESIAG
ncbi:iron ABC transporter ATP-binding protein [Thermococcus sp. EP1]|uniref:ABC transporter substrate-binding protein n=1 Tax=Thermococcus sp. EP1 TaxID=1591054 RepID=UPI0006DA06B5|nr:ABC transporter substrate-binding protein [Thermococcus sp. EP1]KPU62429.1 iron ABC transporter ATP-binding protein [Thermococcus sp. EP1]